MQFRSSMGVFRAVRDRAGTHLQQLNVSRSCEQSKPRVFSAFVDTLTRSNLSLCLFFLFFYFFCAIGSLKKKKKNHWDVVVLY